MSPDVPDMLDVLVAGGGPVGLAAALEARRRGLGVAVVEPREAPIDKACGEGLMPSAVSRLARLGVAVEGRPFVGIRYVRDGLVVESRFRAGPGRGVRRTDLHQAMRVRALDAGAEIVRGSVTSVVEADGHVEAAGMRARWLVAADGLHSPVRRQLGLDRPTGGLVSRTGRNGRDTRPGRFGLRRHYAVVPWTDFVEVHWSPRAEAYVTPVGDRLVGVAVLGPAGTGFDEALAELPALRARLRGAEVAGPVRGAGPLRQRAATVRCGRVLLVGDAAGYVDALTGEGLSTGFACARAAVDAVGQDSPETYPRAWARETRRYRLLTSALLAVSSRRHTRRLLVPVAARVPRGFGLVVDLLA